MVYFIQCGENGPIKIGQTNNGIENRIAQLQVGCPYELKLLWLYKGYDWSEVDIHKHLKAYFIRGEWFHPSEEVFDFIKQEASNTYTIGLNNEQFIEVYETYSGGVSIFESENSTDIEIYNNQVVVHGRRVVASLDLIGGKVDAPKECRAW